MKEFCGSVQCLPPAPHGSTVDVCVRSLSLLERQFLRAFWQTMNREWVGIDRLRLDKFYMVRQCDTKQVTHEPWGEGGQQGLVCNVLGGSAGVAWSVPVLRASKSSEPGALPQPRMEVKPF